MCGTPVGDAILRAHARGAVVAGTSAGASIQSSHMVAFGVGGATPKQRMTQVAAGLGLVDATVIDQHFDQRNRYGRLLMIVAQSPQLLLGIGVDEDTCGLVEDVDGDLVMRVLGKGAVTVFDGARMVSNAYEATRSSPRWRAAWSSTSCRRARSSTSRRVRSCPRSRWSTPRTPTSWPRPAATCASSRATS